MAAPKLPLAVKKAIRDLEPKQTELVAELTKLVGSPVKFEPNFDAVWNALEGHSDQKDLPRVLVESYLPAIVEALKRGLEDDLIKKAFLSQFSSGIITFSIVDDDYESPKGAMATWNLYNGFRLIDGKLDLYTKKGRFWSNVNYVEQIKLSELLANQPGALPLPIVVEIRDQTVKREAVLERMAKATGLDKVTWDINADAEVFVKTLPEKVDEFRALLGYMEALATLLERQCKDDMVKEAIVDAFSAKKVQFRVVPSMKAVSGLKIDTMYNGVQIDNGIITVMTEPSRWWSNVSNVEQLDLISLF